MLRGNSQGLSSFEGSVKLLGMAKMVQHEVIGNCYLLKSQIEKVEMR